MAGAEIAQWQGANPRQKLDIVGTDAVLSLETGEVDISIRYARRAPTRGTIGRTSAGYFLVVANPKLVGGSRKPLTPVELGQFPLIDVGWPASDTEAPTGDLETAARKRHKHVPNLSGLVSFELREELHAIEALFPDRGLRFARPAGRTRAASGLS